MDLNEYAELAARTESPRSVNDIHYDDDLPLGRLHRFASHAAVNHVQFLNAILGLAGETGELQEMIKKYLFHGHKFDTVNAKEELGDILWYVAQGCRALGISMEDAANANINKLAKRYGEKFSDVRSLNRDLDGERKVLEGEQGLNWDQQA